MASVKKIPLTHRTRVENEIIKRREKEFKHDQLWNGVSKYYQQWDKNNTKFEEWTSPRYHETNNKLIADVKQKREKEENVMKRREQLRKLLMEDDKLYEVELMIHKTKTMMMKQKKINDDKPPLDILKEINNSIQIEEKDRQKIEVEKRLYQQWQRNNPYLKQYERKLKCHDLKLSWLDQQIEKRMQKEKEEEECRKLLKEQQKRIKEEQVVQEQRQKEIEQQQQQLKESLEEQIKQLNEKLQISEVLKMKEAEEMKLKIEFDRIEEQLIDQFKKKMAQETALANLKQYKMKLKRKALIIQENLTKEKELIEQLQSLQLEQKIENDKHRNELKATLEQFLIFSEDQKKLEKARQNKLDFLFDSEAQLEYEKQSRIWELEENARQQLIKDILQTIQLQIEDNLRKNQETQKQVLVEREGLLKLIETYDKEMEDLKNEELKMRQEHWRDIDKEVKLKKAKKKLESNQELRRINEELERVRKEEDRLKNEIINMQKRQGPFRPLRSRIFL